MQSIHLSGGIVKIVNQEGVTSSPFASSRLGFDVFLGFASSFIYSDTLTMNSNNPEAASSHESIFIPNAVRRTTASQSEIVRHERIGSDRARIVSEGLFEVVPSAWGQARNSQAQTKMTRSYARHGNQLLLESVLTEINQPGVFTSTTEIQISQIKIFINEAKEQQRREQRRVYTSSRLSQQEFGVLNQIEDCDYSSAFLPWECTSGANPPQDPCPSVAGGADVVFVHGFNSERLTWGNPSVSYVNNVWQYKPGVRPHLRCMLKIENDDAVTLPDNGKDFHENQSLALRNFLDSKSRNHFILIGHSQGGLISRRVAQHYYDNADEARVRGVISVGTPHMGAMAATNLPTVRLTIYGLFYCAWGNLYVDFACGFLENLAGLYVNFVLDAYEGSIGAVEDLKESSSAINLVNSNPENFVRVIRNAMIQHLGVQSRDTP